MNPELIAELKHAIIHPIMDDRDSHYNDAIDHVLKRINQLTEEYVNELTEELERAIIAPEMDETDAGYNHGIQHSIEKIKELFPLTLSE